VQEPSDWPAAPPAPPDPPAPDEWPPAAVVLAGIGAMIGLLPGALMALIGSWWLAVFVIQTLWLPFTEGGSAETVLRSAETVLRSARFLEASLLAVGLPVLLLVGLIHLMRRRDRRLLIVACLPVTAIAAWHLVGHVSGSGDDGWVALVLLGPAVAPLFALAPSVRRWLAERPTAPVHV
jgi:hypothetical protein